MISYYIIHLRVGDIMLIFDKKVDDIYPYDILNKDDEANLFCEIYYKYQFIKKNGLIYHSVTRDKVKIINELIGELVSEYFDLQTVKSVLYKKKSANLKERKYFLLTKIFTNKEFKYSYINELFPDYKSFKDDSNPLNNLNRLKRIQDENGIIHNVSKDVVNKLVNDLKKMIIRDFITGTSDRHEENFVLRYDDNFVELMPLFDYEYSFKLGGRWGNIFGIDLRNEKIVEFLRNDDKFQELLIKAIELKLNYIFKRLEDEYPIRLSSTEKWDYNEELKLTKENIKKYELIRR